MSKKPKHRPSIGEDPLDALVPLRRAVVQAASKASRRDLAPYGTTPKPEPPPKRQRPSKVRATFHLPTDLFDEARDAVVALSGPPARLTLAAMAEAALRRELERMKKMHNNGKPFPKREGELKGGRPIGS